MSKTGRLAAAHSPMASQGLAGSLLANWENAMMAKKRSAALAALCLSALGAPLSVLADEQKPPDSQEHYVPRLNDMMVATQLRHFKLWYAGAVQNWLLANYEVTQIRNAIVDTKRLYDNNSKSNMSTMIPAADDLDEAIKAKDSVKFLKAFGKLTAACNACHEAEGFGFIRIREPRLSPIETSPFSDESFLGR